jgi:hypothetical protein
MAPRFVNEIWIGVQLGTWMTWTVNAPSSARSAIFVGFFEAASGGHRAS